MTAIYIGEMAALRENEAHGFHAGGRDMILWRFAGDDVRGFVNRCPHQGTPLEMFPNRFLDAQKKHLICRTHGARFNGDGLCVAGPCAGQSLIALDIFVKNGKLYFNLDT